MMESNNKRILKNSTLLYLRMFISMCVSFFTTRVVLDVLGVEDYGLKNVVSGFVSMFTYFDSVMQGGSARFLALYIGRNEKDNLRSSFNNSIYIHLMVAVIILLLTETFGLYFLNNKLNISSDRLYAANWIYQFSILAVLLEVMQTPYKALTTAYEKFDIYAYLSILDVILKLIIVYLLIIIKGDKLIIYSSLLTIVSLIIFIFYLVYTKRTFDITKGSFKLKKELLKEMFTFSSWSALGNLSVVLNGQGINVLLNIFLGTVLNAAKGISDTITWIVKSFSSGVLTASVPQLTKLYGANEKLSFFKQAFDSTVIGTFLLSIFAVPVICEIDFFLHLWLKEVPPYTSIFVQIALINGIQSYANAVLDQSVTAAGHVKLSALTSCVIQLAYFPIAYIILKLNISPVFVYITPIILGFFVLGNNLYILNSKEDFPVKSFLIQIYAKSMFAAAFSIAIPSLLRLIIEPSLIRMVMICGFSVILVIFTFYFFVLTQTLREQLIGFVKMKYMGLLSTEFNKNKH